MRRCWFVLLFSALAWGQGVEALIDQILNPETSPSARVRLAEQVAKTPAGAAALAKRGLLASLDAEVVHVVADALFEAGKADEHLESIVALLVSDDADLRNKILRRIQRAAEADPQTLLPPLRDAVLGRSARASKDPDLRVAAVRALCKVPHRSALEYIVEAWGKDAEQRVKDECKKALAGILVVDTHDAARAYLEKHRNDTYFDIVQDTIRQQTKRIRELRRYQEEALRRADAASALNFLVDGDVATRDVISARALQIAKDGEYKEFGAEKYAAAMFDALLFEVKREDRSPVTVANLVATMRVLATGGAKVPFKEKTELIDALRPLAQSPKSWDKVGTACVDLLKGMGDEAAGALVDFARDFKSSEVRYQAIGGLGSLARQSEQMRTFIGTQLAQLLEREQTPAVRQQILFTLGSAPVEAAHAPIRKLLFPDDPGGMVPLTKSELNHCIQVLRGLGADALNTLLELTRSHPDEDVRLQAARDGLLRRAHEPEEAQRIGALLKELLASKDESRKLRDGIVVALGEHGRRAAYDILLGLAPDGEQAARIAEAKLRLAERIATRKKGEPLVREDIQVAVLVLKEAAQGGDPVRLNALAKNLVSAANERKLPVGVARWLRARAYARMPDAKPEELLRLYKEARQKSAADGLNSEAEAEFLLQFRATLEKIPPGPARSAEMVACSRRLADLALQKEQPQQRARYLLDAAERAVGDLKDRELTSVILRALEGGGPLEGALATRLDAVRRAFEALPRKGS